MSEPSPVSSPFSSSEPAEFRPARHNLPTLPTPLIGREREVEAACELLRQFSVRLLTLIGPPGIGKTRLAIEISSRLAAEFSNGTHFVPLAPITDPKLVLPAIAQTIGIKEVADQPLSESMTNYLHGRQILLVLDNFEQVIDAAAEVADLLSHCPGLKVLVTSREVLNIYGEHDYPVPALSLPDLNRDLDVAAIARNDAIKLFVQRAQAISPSFELTDRNAHTVAEICQRLDGLPLTIELAAARIPVLQPEELLVRLKSRLKLLTGGARNLPERQRTLLAAIEWSYNLLDPAEQTLFRRLSVFVGGCTFDAIEQVCTTDLQIDALEVVASLVGKSLLQRQEATSGEPRFYMLETIREYAWQKLDESAESKLLREQHAEYFLNRVEEAILKLRGSESDLWLQRLDEEYNNLRAALEWGLTGGGLKGREGTAKSLRLVGALGPYWESRGYFSEGQQWCAQLLSSSEHVEPSVERAKALRMLARMTWQLGSHSEARRVLEKSLEMSRVLGDAYGTAAAIQDLAIVVRWQGEYDLSFSHLQESLDIGRRLEDNYLISAALSLIGVVLMRKGEYLDAQSTLEEAIAIQRAEGDRIGLASSLAIGATVAIHLDEHEKAKALLEESIGIGRELRIDWIVAFALARFGLLALRSGDPQGARAFLLEGLARARPSGIKRWSRWYVVGLAEVARLQGLTDRAARLIGISEGVLSAVEAQYEPATSNEIVRIITDVQSELDETTFAKLRAEGQALSLEEAMAYVSESWEDDGRRTMDEGNSSQPSYSDATLTEREVEVLRLIAQGKSNQEIGQELVLSRRTVERHISNIYEKIGASGKVARATATAYALRHGLAD